MKSSSTIIATVIALTFQIGKASCMPHSEPTSVLRRQDEGTCTAAYSSPCQNSDVTVLVGGLENSDDSTNTQYDSWGLITGDESCSILGRAVGISLTSSLNRDIVDALNRLQFACGSQGQFTGTTYASGNGYFELLVTAHQNGYQGTNINPN